MKKTLVIVSIMLVALVIAGCAKKRMLDVDAPSQADTIQTGTAEGSTTTTTTPTAGSDLKIAADQKAMREGKKVGGAHSGTVVLLPESMIQVDSNGNLLDGKVLVAMNYITVSDVTDSGMNAK
ncbi:MAG TPA: hypothetical protein PLW93_03650, partial [Candidatus Absconditabacterales bacterium]|nr:hypothetical protein [Candidatus Absconditabacterales bacterium]